MYVASLGLNGAFIPQLTEATAATILNKYVPSSGSHLVRLDAEIDTTYAISYTYRCKLQSLAYPALVGTPWSDVAGSTRTVSWRLGREFSGLGTPISISMQGTVTGGSLGADVRLVCWGAWDGSTQVVDPGIGLTSAVLVIELVGGVG